MKSPHFTVAHSTVKDVVGHLNALAPAESVINTTISSTSLPGNDQLTPFCYCHKVIVGTGELESRVEFTDTK